MSQAYKTASKIHLVGNIKTQQAMTVIEKVLKKGDRVLIRILPEKMTGKMRPF